MTHVRKTGLILSAFAVGSILSKPMEGRILRRFGYKTTLMMNSLGCFIALVALLVVLFFGGESIWSLAPILAAAGFMTSVQFTVLNSLAYLTIHDHRLPNAATFATIAQQASVSSGIILAGLALSLLSSFLHSEAIALTIFGLVTFLSMLPARLLEPGVGRILLERRGEKG